MKIVVPLKQVPDLVEDLEVDSSGKALDRSDIKFKLNEFDDHALEAALLLKEDGSADQVIAVAVDGEDVDKLLFTAIAKGADKAIKITGADPADSHQLAKAFTNIISTEGFDLILTGVQSVDDRDGQLGPIMATYLDVPCVSVVSGVKVSNQTLRVFKEYSGGMMGEFEVDMPAVLGIQAADKTPRYAPVSKIRQVQQTETIQSMDAGDLGPGAQSSPIGMAAPEKEGGAIMLDNVKDLIAVLKEKGVV